MNGHTAKAQAIHCNNELNYNFNYYYQIMRAKIILIKSIWNLYIKIKIKI